MSAQTYNGWANYETWNVTLWIQNDWGLYQLACDVVRDGGTYGDFVKIIKGNIDAPWGTQTPDGVAWDDVNIDGIEVNEMLAELVDWLTLTVHLLSNIMSQETCAAIYRQLFTDSQWDAISSAMKDYADYGNEEAMIADEIDAKISTIFRLTEWYFRRGYSWGFVLISAPTVLDSFGGNVVGYSC